MAITPATIKKLFALSGNQCAFLDCHQMLVLDSTLIGEVCHIESNKPNGPRYNINQSEVERNGIENLLILCPTHHALIDSNVVTYTVEVLKKMKHEYENKHRKDPYKPRKNIIQKALKQERTQNIGVIHGNVSNSPINMGTGTQSITYINHPINETFTSNDNPDVIILVVGQEHSYYFDQLQKVSPNKALIKIEPIKFPDGENQLPAIELPLKFFNWAHPSNYKLFTIAVNNRGKGIGKNVKVDIDFTPCIIQNIEINGSVSKVM